VRIYLVAMVTPVPKRTPARSDRWLSSQAPRPRACSAGLLRELGRA